MGLTVVEILKSFPAIVHASAAAFEQASGFSPWRRLGKFQSAYFCVCLRCLYMGTPLQVPIEKGWFLNRAWPNSWFEDGDR